MTFLQHGADYLRIVRLTAAQIASPTAAQLADRSVAYQLNVAPYTLYVSNGTQLVAIGSGGSGGVALSAPGGSQSTGTVNFANGNGVSFGFNNGTITGSVIQASGTGIGMSAGSSLQTTGTIYFANANGVSFGLNQGTLTVTVQPGAAAGIAAVGAGVSTGTSGTMVFGNANGISFGNNNNTITASYTVPTQSVQTQSRFNLSIAGNTSGTATVASSGVVTLAGGNNITLSQIGNAITISAPNIGAGAGISAQGNSQNSGTVVFSNSNNVTFGMAGSVVTASVTAAQSNQTIGLFGVGNTTNATSGTVDARLMSFQGNGGMTIGVSNGSVQISAPSLTSLAVTGALSATSSGATISLGVGTVTASAQGNTTQASTGTLNLAGMQFNGAGNISVGVNNGSVLISGNTVANNPINVSAGTTSNNLGSLVFNDGGGISFGLFGSTLTATVVGGGAGGAAISAGTNSRNSGTVYFANANGITFGLSNDGTLTASHNALTTQAPMAFSAGVAQSNFSTLVFQNSNGISFSNNAGSVRITHDLAGTGTTTGGANITASLTLNSNGLNFSLTVPATSNLVGAGGLTVSSAGSTISVSASNRTRHIHPMGMLGVDTVGAHGNGSVSFGYVPINWPISASRMDGLVYWSADSAANANTAGIAMSIYGAIFTRNGSTLSSASSGSTQTTYTYASNSAGQTQLQAAAMRPVSVPANIVMTPGEYFVGFNIVTANTSVGTATTALGQTVSIYGQKLSYSANNYAEFTAATATSQNLQFGAGIYSAASTGLSGVYSLSQVNQTGTAAERGQIAVVFRNA
jgi:hypothetical protein